ncbi:quaternary ammonium compound efflux SMR transporter SugE [Rhodobacter ferrooxidans]|uniref:Guanidinium exporter n=1 Tax=Rhodobacter ferrooxidans TaxID=371731 RepID=C8S2C5_9RHOB|nr:quaternary ammonium compound efflux SMR transporter SugE [Rhodobacter sp. SW2]EEW24796.1 small multidrug resistance protein [Rhodobacter sp. SW2]
MSNPWVVLILAGIFEMVWAIGLKYTDGFSRLWPSVLTLVAMVISVLLLAQAMKTLPVGTAYAVWTGIGTLGTAILAVFLFGEPVTVLRLAGIGLILAGIVALKLA